MTSEYGKRFAEIYDLLYKNKPYEAECDFIEKLFEKHKRNPEMILDVGCGTGGHSMILADMGYGVIGIDKSEAMINLAKSKTYMVGFIVADVKNEEEMTKFHSGFDAVVSMFGTLDYITQNLGLVTAFRNIRNSLKKGGLFIFEVWNGLAVIRNDLVESFRREFDMSRDVCVWRISKPELNVDKHVCKVDYTFSVFQGGEKVDEFKEIHNIRFFFPMEIKHYLEEAGFKVLDIVPSMNPDREVGLDDWWMTVVAEAI